MLEKLRNMEPMPEQETNRINSRLRLTVILLAVAVLAYVIWSIVTKRQMSGVYYVIVAAFLLCNWGLSDVAPIFVCRALAGKSNRQVQAYLKLAGLGLLANFGLGWFLIAMNNQSIYGAIMYLIGVSFARKQREIYEGTAEEEEQVEEVKQPTAPEHLPTASDRLKRLNELSSQLPDEEPSELEAQLPDEEPSELEAQLPDEELATAEPEDVDGSV